MCVKELRINRSYTRQGLENLAEELRMGKPKRSFCFESFKDRLI